jgi:hypothetical protein
MHVPSRDHLSSVDAAEDVARRILGRSDAGRYVRGLLCVVRARRVLALLERAHRSSELSAAPQAPFFLHAVGEQTWVTLPTGDRRRARVLPEEDAIAVEAQRDRIVVDGQERCRRRISGYRFRMAEVERVVAVPLVVTRYWF